MAKISRVTGTTSQIVEIFVLDSASASGAGKTGLTNASVTCYYKRNSGAASVSATVNSISTLGTYAGSATNAAFGAVDGTNMPGLYEFHLPNNALATGADEAVLMLTGTGIVPVRVEIELTGTNNQDAVHGGMSALPNTACTTNASLLTSGTGTDQLEVASGRVDLGKIAGSAVATGTAQLGVNVVQYNGQTAVTDANNLPKVDVEDWKGTAVSAPATAGIPDINLKNIANAAVATATAQLGVNVVNVAGSAAAVDANGMQKVDVEDWKGAAAPAMTGDAFARLGAPAGASVSADIAAAPNTLLDFAAGIETGYTVRQGLRLFLASLAGLLSGAATTTVTITNPANTKNRIIATVDANGNRSSIAYDLT